MTEGIDHAPGVAIDEDESGGSDIEGESVEGDGEEKGGEAGEFGGIFDINDDEEHEQGDADAGREEEIEEESGDGEDEEEDRSEESEDEEEIALFEGGDDLVERRDTVH